MSPGGQRLRSVAVALLVVWSCAALAEIRALLIGVSGYPALDRALRLQGPPQDVQQLRQALLARGVADARIRVLADGVPGVPGALLPTRDAILQALRELAREASRGDIVVVHFSGHGSRQPDRERPGQLLPTLLPLDVGRWDGGTQTVFNALTRDEVRAAIDGIAQRGAFVWAVFDACNSSGLVRGAEGAGVVQSRAVEPGDLGVPPSTVAGWPKGFDETPPHAVVADTRGGSADEPPASARGGSAYFYAAQSSESAGELDLPQGGNGGRRRGLLSFVLSRLLEEQRPMSYRQLGQAIQATYRTIDGARLTPVFAGDGLDTQVLGQATLAVRQWPLRRSTDGAEGWHVGAGRLHGIGPGAVFALVPDVLSRDGDVLGYLQVTQADLDDSRLVAVPHNGRLALAPAALQPGVQQLRLVSNAPAFNLRIAFDPTGCAAPCRLRDAVQQLRASGIPGVDARWVDAGEMPELRLRAHQGRVLLLTPADGAQASPAWADVMAFEPAPGQPADLLAQQLRTRLHAHARVRNLSILAAQSSTDPKQAALNVTLRKRGDTALIGLGSPPALRHGDRLVLALNNRGPATLDVTVFYLDADDGIGRVFPSNLGDVNRLEAGDVREVPVRINPPSVGNERLLLIAAQVGRGDDPVDFGFLEQPSMPRRRDESVESGELLAAFADAGFADYTRRGEPLARAPSTRTLVRTVELEVRR